MSPLPARYARLRWTGFTLLAGAFVLGFFHRIAPGVVAPQLMASFDISAAALGTLAAMYYYMYTALQIPSGILSDTLGPRYSVGFAILIAALGSIVFGLAPNMLWASIGRILVGFGVAFTFVGLMKFNAQWFPESRYGAISGLTLLVGNLGAILGASPLAAALEWASWRQVFVAMGALSGGLALAILLLLRNRPEDAGLPNVRELEGLPPHAPPQHHWGRELAAVLRNPDIWPGFFAMLGVVGAVLGFVGLWAVPFMQQVHGLALDQAALYATGMLIGAAVGSFFGGSVSDRLGRRRPVAVAFALLALCGWIAIVALPWQPGWGALLLFSAVGLAAGGATVVYAVAKEVAQPLFSGMAIAVVNTGLFLGAALVQPLFGWIMDLSWDGQVQDGIRLYAAADYRNGLYLLIAFATLGLLGCGKLRETHCRNVSTPRPSRPPPPELAPEIP